MHLVTQCLWQFFKQYPDRPILVAYSGGVDSQVLLHALASLKAQQVLTNPLTVCHINHGLSENALTWQQSAQQFCQQLDLPLIICPVNIKQQAQHSLEALARDARYQALYEQAAEQGLIVTGHHSDDQSETFLLALKRGAGLKGLSAMSTVTTFLPEGNTNKQQLLVRPLLTLTRQDIIAYAEQMQLTWLEDESNLDQRFDRNFIRHQVMPLLQQRWPSIAKTIGRTSEHCREGQQLLTELAQQDLIQCQIAERCLSVQSLQALSLARFNNVLRYFLQQQQVLMPSSAQLAQVYRQLSAPIDKVPEIKLAKHWLRRYQDGLYLTNDLQSVSQWFKTVAVAELVSGQICKLTLPDKLGHLMLSTQTLTCSSQFVSQRLRLPLGTEKVSVRFQHQNPKCHPDFRQHSRSLKKVLQELLIPPWGRKRLPFLYYDEQLVAAAGYFVCKEFLPQANDLFLNLYWCD